MQINSIAYRVLTFFYIGSGAAASFRDVNLNEDVASALEATLLAVARAIGLLAIPAYLSWRNLDTLWRRQPLIPATLVAHMPWQYRTLIFFVWLQFVLIALPIIGAITEYADWNNSVPWSMHLANLGIYGLWWNLPIIFFAEVICASHRSRHVDA